MAMLHHRAAKSSTVDAGLLISTGSPAEVLYRSELMRLAANGESIPQHDRRNQVKAAGEGELPTTDQNADRVAGRKVGRRSMVVWAMPSPWVAVEAGTDLLARARQIQRSWDRLLGEGALGPELPPHATAGMRPMIVESWRRVLATGLEPIDVLPSIEADQSETRERWLEHPLGLLRHVLVEPLQMLAEESNSVVQVTDP